jgi:hypothetical protein
MDTHKEIVEGLNGSGQPVYMVVTINKAGQWDWIERFDNLAEAECWKQWA